MSMVDALIQEIDHEAATTRRARRRTSSAVYFAIDIAFFPVGSPRRNDPTHVVAPSVDD